MFQFLEKMVNDRNENVSAIQKIADQIREQSDGSERQHIDSEVKVLLEQWQNLKQKVDERSEALNDNLGTVLVPSFRSFSPLCSSPHSSVC